MDTLRTGFSKLNHGWDADRGVPLPEIHLHESGLTLTFFLNSEPSGKGRDFERGELYFPNCWRYRLGPPDDDGWWKGRCRFRCWAQEHGEFYEVTGDLREDGVQDWALLKAAPLAGSHHYLFYFKDETFECDAEGWSFQVPEIAGEEYARLRAQVLDLPPLPRMTLVSIVGSLAIEPFRAARRWLRRVTGR